MNDLINGIKSLNKDKTDIIHTLSENFDKLYNDYFELLTANWIIVVTALLSISILSLQIRYLAKKTKYYKRKHQSFSEELRAEVRKYYNCF